MSTAPIHRPSTPLSDPSAPCPRCAARDHHRDAARNACRYAAGICAALATIGAILTLALGSPLYSAALAGIAAVIVGTLALMRQSSGA